jgi:hypothetical protein
MARADKRLYRPGDESAFAEAQTDRLVVAAAHPHDEGHAGRAGPRARGGGAGLLVAIALVIGLLAGTIGTLALRSSTTAGKQDASVPSPLSSGLGTGSNTTQSPSPTSKAIPKRPKSTAIPTPKSSTTTPAAAVSAPKASTPTTSTPTTSATATPTTLTPTATVAAPTPVHTQQAPARYTQPVTDGRNGEIVGRGASGRPLRGASSARAGENGT